LTGFKKSINQGVHLQIGDTSTLNIKLQAGGTSETVTVTAQVAIIDTISASVGKVVSTRQIEALPLVARDPMQLFYLQPGTNRFTGGGRVDGTRGTAANVTVEGVGATEPVLGSGATSTTAAVIIEAVGEYRVVTSSASAEYGRGGGAQIQLVYRSGTNSFHGSAFDFLRNRALNANTFANNKQGFPKPTYIRNQFGGSIGGPVIKDRAFFHFTYEGIRQKQETTPNFLVYTPTLKNTGIFRYYTKGANSTTLVDSLTGAPKVPDTDIATINLLTVDSTRLGKDPSGLFDKLVGIFPNPNNYDTGDGFNTAGYRLLSNNPYTQNQYVFKGDLLLTRSQRISATYTYLKYVSPGAITALTGYREPNSEPYPTGIVAWDATLTPRWLNEFRVGGTKRGADFLNSDPDRSNPQGIVVFAGLGGPGRGHPKDIMLPQSFPSPVITITDNTTWIKSDHSLKGGADVRVNRSNVKYGDDYYFPVAYTTNANNPANVPALAGLASADRTRAAQLTNDLTGTLGGIQQSFHSNTTSAFTPFETKYRRWRSREYSFFFQDTWKFRPNQIGRAHV
jgi:hypothetical protein